MPNEPAAFMSYVRFDDQHNDGQLTEFRERLSAEVRMQTGAAEFAIFQDRHNIAWGQNWQRRINGSLDAATLLLVIVTPSLFRSRACRDEVERFLDRERELGGQDLILPVYYISAQEMDDSDLYESDELVRVLASRQYADWRDRRFEPFTSPVVRKDIAQLAARMRDAFGQPPAAAPGRLGGARGVVGSPSAGTEPGGTPGRATAKTEPPTHVVDAYQRGDFARVSDAIKAARPGDRILVRPGLYEEGLVIDKPLEILGDGPVSEIEIRAATTAAVLFKANIGRVANLTLRQAAGESWFGVDITQGRLDLEGCDISSQSLACVAIRDGADPRLRRNRIHDGKQGGVYVYDNGLGTLEDNDISGNAFAGVETRTGGNPTLRRNQIHDGAAGGVYVYDNGLGTLEDNDITGNALSGVAIKAGGHPTLRRNRIHNNKQSGVFVYENGLGTLEDNDITGNARSGVETRTGGNPKLRANRINNNADKAVRIRDGGRGVVEDNDLQGNAGGTWEISEDSKDNVTRARNKE